MAVNWGSLFKQIAIGIAVNIGIQILTDKDRDVEQGEPKLPESDPQKPLPLFWGTHRVGLNIFRDGKIAKKAIKQDKTFFGIKYGSRTVGYEYRITAASWLGHGTISMVSDVILNQTKVLTRLGQQNFQTEAAPIGSIDSFGNLVSARRLTTTTTASGMSTPPYFLANQKYPDGVLFGIGSPNVLGENGGVGGLIRVYPGDGSHNEPASLAAINAVSVDPTYVEPSYPEWAYILFENCYLGNAPQLPSVEWIVARPPITLGSGARFLPWEANPFGELPNPFAANSGLCQGDANPAGVLYEMLTNRKTGMGIPRAFVYDQDFVDAWETLQDENFGLSPMIDAIRAGEDDINDILRHIDGVVYWDLQMGKYRMRLLRPSAVDPSTLPSLDASNVTSLEYAETALNENINEVKVEYTNVFRDFLKDIVRAQNLAGVQQAQRVNSATVAYMWITRPTLALQVAQRDLRVRSTIIGRGSVVGDRSLIERTPGELVRVTWPEKGLFDRVCRIGEINYGTLVDGKITATFVEDYWSLEAPSYETSDPTPPSQPPTTFVVPDVEVDVALDTFDSITYNLLITDPSNAVTDVAYQEQVGNGAPTAWTSDLDGVYTYEMVKNPVYSTRAFWRVTYTDQDGDPQEIVGEFPQPTVGNVGLPRPSLSFIYSGVDVIVTASAPVGATGVKFASAMNTPPSDATVLAATPDITGPYAITVTAPTGTQVLHVGAAATDGTIDSLIARIAIPPKPVSSAGAEVLLNGSDAMFPAGRDVNDSATIEWDFTAANLALAEVIDGSLGIDKLSAPGVRDATTFLRGDDTFSPLTAFPGPGGAMAVYQDVTKVTGTLADNASSTQILDIAPTVAFQHVVVSAGAWVRIYGTMAALLADASRAFATDPTWGSASQPIFEAAPGVGGFGLTTILVDNMVAHNADSPRIGRFYMSVTNKSGGSTAITTTVRYLPLEGDPAAIPPDVTGGGLLYRFNAQSITPVADGTETLNVANTGSVGGNWNSPSGFGSGPRYYASRINGHPAIYCVSIGGNTRAYNVPSWPGTPPTEGHIFAVMRPAASSVAWSFGGDNTNPTVLDATSGGTNTDRSISDTTAHNFTAGVDPTLGQLYHFHGTPTLYEAYVGLVQKVTTGVNTVAWGQHTLGGYYSGGFFTNMYNGDIGEFRLYSGVLTDDEVLGIKLQMSSDWGISL